MSNLLIKELSIFQARDLDSSRFFISLKRDGTLMYFKDNNLISARGINRNNRFFHILKILREHKFFNCYGEMYVEGGNVFSVTSREGWNKAKFMPIDVLDFNLNYKERQILLREKIKEINSPFITQQILFEDVDVGWKYVLDNKQEGLILRNDREFYKIKVLQEAKVKIKSHEQGKDKGTFILENGNRISGTSMEFVLTYLKAKEQNKEVFAEIEFSFITKDNHYFQPRLRRIFEKEE